MAGNEPGGRSCTSFVCFTAQASCKALAYYDDYMLYHTLDTSSGFRQNGCKKIRGKIP